MRRSGRGHLAAHTIVLARESHSLSLALVIILLLPRERERYLETRSFGVRDRSVLKIDPYAGRERCIIARRDASRK